MYQGEIVEWGQGEQVTQNPQHAYTKRLMMAAPVPNPVEQTARREERRRMMASGLI
jgi:peptide/nickel transport system ATP-binding protein